MFGVCVEEMKSLVRKKGEQVIKKSGLKECVKEVWTCTWDEFPGTDNDTIDNASGDDDTIQESQSPYSEAGQGQSHGEAVDTLKYVVNQSDYTIQMLLKQIIASLHHEFSMTDLGSLNYFMGNSVTRTSSGIFYPSEPHFSALKQILRYVHGTLDHGLHLFSSSTASLVAYSNADWAGCLTTRRSTSGCCVFFDNNLLSWSSKGQPTLSRSSAEAEYRGVAHVVAETSKNLGAKFGEYGSFLPTYQRSPFWPHSKTPPKVPAYSSPSPNNAHIEVAHQNSSTHTSASQPSRNGSCTAPRGGSTMNVSTLVE
nr:ribonuclease H-like domain-containing protein [Tanacetum cinerariifolium]